MRNTLMTVLVAVGLATTAEAADPAAPNKPAAANQAGMMDMSKAGPMTRLPKNAQDDHKQLDEFFKSWAAASQKGDVETMASMVDFPVMMMTDNSKGVFSESNMSRDQWMAVMKPGMDPAKMKDVKMSHSGKCFLLSDDLASCEAVAGFQMGKMKGQFNTQSIMVRKDGKWMMKSMMESGWGDMPMPNTGTGGAGTTGNMK